MHRTAEAPPPINLLTTWAVYIYQKCKRGLRKKEKYKRMKPETTQSRLTDFGDTASLAKKRGKVSPYDSSLGKQ